MRENRFDEKRPWSVPVAVEDIPDEGQHVALAAPAEARADIARLAGLRDLARLELNFELTRQGAGVRIAGRVSASVGQNCVVTLEALTNEIEEDVNLLFMPRADAAPASGEADADEPAEAKWNDPEPLTGGKIDLGAIATEFLLLGVDPYPRKPGAVFEPPSERPREGGPFAGLAGWVKDRNEH